MSKVCCRFYPACYCLELPNDPVHEQRMRILRDGAPRNPINMYAELQSRRRAQSRRNAIIICVVAFVVSALVLALALAGCGPDDGVIKPSSPAPQPTTTEMFTVIRPPVGHLAGGIYDNN